MEIHEKFMQVAIELASENIKNGGGPFGAVIVCNGEVVGRGANRVTSNNDPTAHAEIMAIRDASSMLNRFDLSDCTLYTSCEPCPMCLGAIYWARIKNIYYGNTRADAAEIGFDDDYIYSEISLPLNRRSVAMTPMLRSKAIKTFYSWAMMLNKESY
ncbi:MAG: nucleoside deaminase [Cytophagaceae bacterium]|jgi:tRNA(Arg) A34 adenosine deaminase TadA|nr:nucleoside deaminase [Cytophagaceae bacterium]